MARTIKVLHILGSSILDHSIIENTMPISSECSVTTKQEAKPTLIPFPAASEDYDYRYLRTRTTILCAALNAQPFDVPEAESARAWHEYLIGLNQPTAPDSS
jgi:hypothetical protein